MLQEFYWKFLAQKQQRFSEKSYFSILKAMDFEKIALEVFPELDQDLVPYVASIVEENKSASADELADILTPILTGYDVVPEEEIGMRCKKIPPLLSKGQKRKPYVLEMPIILVALWTANPTSWTSPSF